MARLSGKLTAKSLGWSRNEIGPAVAKIGDDDRIHLGRIVGIVSGLRQTVSNETGEIQNGLKGQFRGISSRVDDKGEALTVTSGVCYLPGGMQDMVEGALATAQETDPKATVQFGLDLYAIRAANAAGYSFNADTVIEASEADPLDAMLATAAAATALPAPSKVEGPAAEPVKVATTEAVTDTPAPTPAETAKGKGK